MTISAALQQGVVQANQHFSVPYSLKVADGLFSDAEKHGTENWTTTDILANSSNVGTIGIAQKLGKTALDQYLRKFGFGQVERGQLPR